MKHTLRMLLILVLAVTGCGKKKETAAQPTNATASSEYDNPLNAPAQYLGAMNQAQKLATKTVDKASIDRAIQMFYAQEERFPKNLQELVVQHFLQSVPEPPRGARFLYNPTTGEFKIVRDVPANVPASH